MKKSLLVLGLFVAIVIPKKALAQRYKVVTIVESIVPMGMGRSRIIDERQDSVNYKKFTTKRVDGKHTGQHGIKRKNIKIDAFNETKLLNFYSGVGINFRNIASNDAVISSKINAMVEEGWELVSIFAGVESSAGGDDPNGIFITRILFKR